MKSSDIQQRLDALLNKLTERNKVVQEKKASSNPASWIIAVVLALLSLVGIGVAMYLANRRAKELAKAKTELEHIKIDKGQMEYDKRFTEVLGRKTELSREITAITRRIDAREKELHLAEIELARRKTKIEKMTTWKELNEL